MSSLHLQCVDLLDRPEDLPIKISRSRFSALIIAILICALLMAILFICIKTYTKRTTVQGETTIDKGLIRISANSSGTVTRIFHNEGDIVKFGDPLFEISNLTTVNSKTRDRRLFELLQENLGERAKINQENRSELINSQQKLAEKISERRKNLDDQIRTLKNELVLQDGAIQRAEDGLSRNQLLVSGGFLSPMTLKASEDDLTVQRMRKMSLERQEKEIKNQADTIAIELAEIDIQGRSLHTQYVQEQSRLQAESAELISKYSSIITAPASGVLRTLTINKGEAVSSAPLAVIIPIDSLVSAQLLVPSRSIGFVEVGQKVRLRYHAYPYQKYGIYEGIISDISITPLPNMNPQATTENSDIFFRIKLNLPEQLLSIDDKSVPLVTGMTFDADIEIGTRRIVEWIIEPLLSLKNTF